MKVQDVHVEINPTIQELANEITDMWAEDQAALINVIGSITRKWEGSGLGRQLLSIQDCFERELPELTDDGRWFIKTFVEYMKDSAEDWKLDGIDETSLMDVFKYES